MNAAMDPMPRRILLSHAPPEAYAPMSRAILAKLGYAIVTEDEYAQIAEMGGSGGDLAPDLRIVDERNLAEVPDDGGPSVPIIVLTGRHGATGADSRIAAAVRRPAGMHELYSVAQQILEESPRSTPRVPTHMSARCERGGESWRAAVLSLSENGCLLRSPEPLPLGSHLTLHLDLPTGAVKLDAECAYQLLPDVGLVFHAARTSVRSALAATVNRLLRST